VSEVWIRLPTEHGEVRVTVAQMFEVGRLCALLDDPVWHSNECGCCVAVHERADSHRGYVVGADGGSDWVDMGIRE
jgi:hypothetical protein